MAPGAKAPCPQNVSDCQAWLKNLPSSSGTAVTAQLTAGNYYLDATLDVEGKAKAGARGTVTVTVSSNGQGVPAANLTFSLSGAVGVTWDEADTDGLATPGYTFGYDPADVGTEFPTWTFHFNIDSASHIVVPVDFSAQEDGGPLQTDAGLLPMTVASEGDRSTLAQWALPSLLGLAVGILLTATFLRRKRA